MKTARDHGGGSFPAAKSSTGFTLVELLVVIAIVAVLSFVAFAATRHCMRAAAQAREMGAGRNLSVAHASYAADNGDAYIIGVDGLAKNVPKANGSFVGAPVDQRWVFRLAPYFNFGFDTTILINGNGKKIEKLYKPGSSNHDYFVSIYPALGINHVFIGGNRNAKGKLFNEQEVVTTRANADPDLMVFASAGTGEDIAGFHTINAPNMTARNWSSVKWGPDSSAGDYGYVDARYNGKAICVFLDGSVRSLTIEELRDMRLWSRNARIANNPDYMIE